jgi:hypothetical protein
MRSSTMFWLSCGPEEIMGNGLAMELMKRVPLNKLTLKMAPAMFAER